MTNEIILDKQTEKNLNESALSITPDQLDKMIISYQQNPEEDLFNKIYKIYKPKFEKFAYKMKNEDMVQELSLALLKAVGTFQLGKQAKFNTYFWTVARNHIGTLKMKKVTNRRQINNIAISLQSAVHLENGEVEIGALIEDENVQRELDDLSLKVFMEKEIYRYLPEKEAQAIQLYIDGYTMDYISKKTKLSVASIYGKINKLKKNEKLFNAIIKYFEIDGIKINATSKCKKKFSCEEIAKMIETKLKYKSK